MKKIFLFTTISALAISSCTSFDGYDENAVKHATEQEIRSNAESVFGTNFSPNQDWTMSSTGTIKITADANFDDIVKVQVLSESPYLNSNAMVLNQAPASKGETVELAFEAPKGLTRLIAACVNSQGEYYITGFDVNATQVNFASTSKARTRAGANGVYPSLNDLQMDYSKSIPSFNAVRTQKANDGNTDDKIKAYKNSNWENERLWRVSDKAEECNGWKIVNGSIVREIGVIDETEKQTLNTIFQEEMGGFQTGTTKYNNIEAVRNTKLFEENNYITSDGSPLILTPVSMNSFELGNVYYYYFDPAVLNSMSETEKVNYLKALPKFRAINCDYTREEAYKRGFVTPDDKKHYSGFFNLHEYLLPFYGDPSEFVNNLKHDLATTDDNVYYRIRHGKKENGKDLYLTYLGSSDNMSPKLASEYKEDDDNYANQLWQIFDYNDKHILYNIGSQKYLITGNDKGEYTNYSDKISNLKNNLYDIIEKDGYILIKSNWAYLGSDIGRKTGSYRVALNKPENDGDYIKWYLETYKVSEDSKPDNMMANIDFGAIQFIKNAEGIAIPENYKIGFLHRKGSGDNSNSFLAINNGETYGDGRLNKEINTFPNFSSSISQYGMRDTDPRIAIFKANGKKYMTFEEGVDCNYTDMVIEISSGMREEIEPLAKTAKGAIYTFCFEDRELGDYDMNDVIIKATRMDETHVLFSLEACGAHDELFIKGIKGQKLNDLVEVHKLFGVEDLSFINTQGGEKCPSIQEIIVVPKTYSFSNTEKDQIYIYNQTMGYEIKLSTKGQDPHAIIIPCDFEYPLEKTSINNANSSFVKWGEGDNTYYNWYNHNDKSKVYSKAGLVVSDEIKQKYPQYFNDSK